MHLKDGFLFSCGMLLALCIILIVAGNSFAAGGATTTGVNLSEYSGTICVSGNGYVYADPDIAKITIGVITEASTSTQAMADNANKMDGVVRAIRSLGIAEKDIQTSRVSVEPEYASENTSTYSSYYYPAKQNIIGYKATNTVTVTVRDISRVGQAIDAANNAGSNTIQGVTFLLSDERQAQAYNEALQKAIKDGSTKANTMATAAGVSGYKLKSLSESGGYYPMYSDNVLAGEALERATAVTTPVSAGQAKVQATVSMNYVFIPQ
jgi:uncharacterized protein YggE